MLSPFRKQKFTHLFKILDFDHDGLIEESDFIDLGENIAIFNCLDFKSPAERLIVKRGYEVWKTIARHFKNKHLVHCDLNQWLEFLEFNTSSPTSRMFNVVVDRVVQDIFFIYNKNGDRFITKQEYMCFFVSLRIGMKQWGHCFRALDVDNDGLLSENELRNAILEFLLSEEVHSPGNYLFGNSDSFNFNTKTGSVKYFPSYNYS